MHELNGVNREAIISTICESSKTLLYEHYYRHQLKILSWEKKIEEFQDVTVFQFSLFLDF